MSEETRQFSLNIKRQIWGEREMRKENKKMTWNNRNNRKRSQCTVCE